MGFPWSHASKGTPSSTPKVLRIQMNKGVVRSLGAKNTDARERFNKILGVRTLLALAVAPLTWIVNDD